MCKNTKVGRVQIAVVFLVVGFSIATFLFESRERSSLMNGKAAAQTIDSTSWEYTTVSIEPASLQSTLTSLGFDGWEIFAMTTTDAIVEEGSDRKSHLTTQRIEITGKRKRR